MDHAGKVSLLTGGRDLAAAAGLEIGPRDSPLVHKQDGRVLYADYADTETVRANLHGSGVDPSGVLEVDIVTGGGTLAAVMPHRVEYVVASHVVEHVPDLLGWLLDVHDVLNPEGTLGLAVPDRRFTFDRFRAESTIAEAVEAYLLKTTRPSLRQVFDSAWPAVEIGVDQAWRNEIPERASAPYRLAHLKPAMRLIRRLHADPIYNDAHCWVFTPASFLDILEQAAWLDMLPFTVQDFHPTELHGYEFYAVLRRAESGDAAILETIQAARAKLADWEPERVFARAHPAAEILALQAQNAALHDALETMRRSTFWRMSAPVRKLLDRLRG